ncbi:type II toxin-antitoxin system VapC family toxin [Candidatus Williamhamiltonella defendens]|uniref:VapC toxin family PIN domain ribonuclease n=2 Tax=Candidatus Williamhamiltonella TaxID=568987 RepID=A0A2D3TFA3_9ENTR|nr:type II toxin-antitoxin system VapC family toxin [Candidatus Hamiltonella defensa]ATW34181.1 VapC toxin family PIN domain ribonuclease [Candidatus Hamiltonella defensa]
MYLLDTNIISEIRKIRPHGAVVSWIENIPDASLFLSAVTIGEIQAGIEITREQDAIRASSIETWLTQISSTYNVLPMSAETFQLWAKLMHRKSNTLYEDAMIAATALTHNLTVVTRNTRDFEAFDLPLFNPFLNNYVT